MKKIALLCLLTLIVSANKITPNEVYAQSELIQKHVHFLLKHYSIKHTPLKDKVIFSTSLKPRDVWQKAYEILIKINMFRAAHGMVRMEPVGMEPVEHLNPDMVYGQTQRILTEIKIAETRLGIKIPKFQLKKYKNKKPLDVFNNFSRISIAFDELNRSELSPNYVFAETMRIYDDLTTILNYLGLEDNTVPGTRLDKATPSESLKISMKVLSQIQKLQRSVGIETVDFSSFNKRHATPSDVYTVTEMIIAELQPIKAYIGLTSSITPPALSYTNKVPADIEQLMGWNFKKISLINQLDRR